MLVRGKVTNEEMKSEGCESEEVKVLKKEKEMDKENENKIKRKI